MKGLLGKFVYLPLTLLLLCAPILAEAACFGEITGFGVGGGEVTIYFSPQEGTANKCKVNSLDQNHWGTNILEAIKISATLQQGKPWLSTEFCDSGKIASLFEFANAWCGKVQVSPQH